MEENIALESTTSTEQGTDESVNAQDAETAMPSEDTVPKDGADAIGSDSTSAEAEAPFLEIKYNHQKKGLTKDEAITLAQKGMHYEGAYKALERIATLEGKTIDEYLASAEQSRDDAYRQRLEERFGDDTETIDKMMELYSIKKEKTLASAQEDAKKAKEKAEQSENERIANEFVKMKDDFPELTDFASLPDAVKRAAAEGMPLPYAYLQYQHKEAKKIEDAQKAQSEASKKSTGPMSTSEADSATDAEKRYLNALWGR